MLTMLALVVVFGIQSLVDWTWYVPGDACVALLCAGWLAGRGELAASARPAAPPQPRAGARGKVHFTLPWVGEVRADARAAAIACAAVIAALLAAWSQWQPQRSEDARQQSLALLAREPRAALDAANTAVARDPLSAEAMMTLAHVQQVGGQSALARATLQRAVRLQPSNPQTWLALGRYDLARDPRSAVQELQAAIYLNPESIAPEALAKERQAVEIHNDYIQALRAATQLSAPATSANGRHVRAAGGARRGSHR
jgi:tetratricopeptide (TPR) repeat protein